MEEDDIEPPLKRRKLLVEVDVDKEPPVLQYFEGGEPQKPPPRDLDSNFKRQLHLFSEDRRKLKAERTPIYRPPVSQGTLLFHLSHRGFEKDEKLVDQHRLLEESMVSMEKLKTFSRDFKENFQLHQHKAVSKCSQQEINNIKIQNLRNVKSILQRGMSEFKKRCQRRTELYSLLETLRSAWAIKRTGNLKKVEMFVDISIDSKNAPVYLRDQHDSVELVFGRSIVYGKRPVRVNDLDDHSTVMELLNLAQYSYLDQQVFRLFIQTVQFVTSRKFGEKNGGKIFGRENFHMRVLKQTNFEVFCSVNDPGKFVMVRLVKNADYPLWQLVFNQNFVPGNKMFNSMCLNLLRLAVVKNIRRREMSRERNFYSSAQTIEFEMHDEFIEILKFINHYLEIAEIIRKLKMKHVFVECTKFEFPSKCRLVAREIDAASDVEMIVENGMIEMAGYTVAYVDIERILYLVKNVNKITI